MQSGYCGVVQTSVCRPVPAPAACVIHVLKKTFVGACSVILETVLPLNIELEKFSRPAVLITMLETYLPTLKLLEETCFYQRNSTLKKLSREEMLENEGYATVCLVAAPSSSHHAASMLSTCLPVG